MADTVASAMTPSALGVTAVATFAILSTYSAYSQSSASVSEKKVAPIVDEATVEEGDIVTIHIPALDVQLSRIEPEIASLEKAIAKASNIKRPNKNQKHQQTRRRQSLNRLKAKREKVHAYQAEEARKAALRAQRAVSAVVN